jgi:enoyl-CoA hydratase/carnithine racemase
MSYETLIVDQAGAIAMITLNRPDARNAFDLAMRRELLLALDEIEANPAARVVILTGAGGHFCAAATSRTCASAVPPPTGRCGSGSSTARCCGS